MSPTSAKEFFAPNGPLQEVLSDFRHRPEQAALAESIENALRERRSLLTEAGTGVGKTLAYLVPIAASGLRAVISTGTKALQDQLIEKDIPLLQEIWPEPLDVQLMKGRGNYLCLHRSRRFFAQQTLDLSDKVAKARSGVRTWAQETQTGDRRECTSIDESHAWWQNLTANGDQCLGRSCEDFERCWLFAMRRQAQSAQILVVNHHLYFSDLALRGSTPNETFLIPSHDVVVFDEAHGLAEAAEGHFGISFSDRRIEDLLKDASSLDAEPTTMAKLGALRKASQQLFAAFPFEQPRSLVTTDALAPPQTESFDTLEDALQQVEAEFDRVSDPERDAIARRARVLHSELYAFRNPPTSEPRVVPVDASGGEGQAPQWVQFAERIGNRKTFVSRPVRAGSLLAPHLEETPAIYLSATMTVRDSFKHFREQVGLQSGSEEIHGSPFCYEDQVRLYVPDDLIAPENPSFSAQGARRVAELVETLGGSTLILCTSYRALNTFAQTLRDQDPDLLVQGEAPRTDLLDRFRENPTSSLVATLSFWQGVDVPGDALRMVVIDRLPFQAPNDPLWEAQANEMKQRDIDPFFQYQVPRAALLLRQAFGRLIRKHDDRGLVTILDRRLLERRYGKTLLKALPECPRLSSLEEAKAYLAEL